MPKVFISYVRESLNEIKRLMQVLVDKILESVGINKNLHRRKQGGNFE